MVTAFREALEAVGSISLNEFSIRFNVDILSPLVKHADAEVSRDDPQSTPLTTLPRLPDRKC